MQAASTQLRESEAGREQGRANADTQRAAQAKRWSESARRAHAAVMKAGSVVAAASTRVLVLEQRIAALAAEAKHDSATRAKNVVQAAVKLLELVRKMAGCVFVLCLRVFYVPVCCVNGTRNFSWGFLRDLCRSYCCLVAHVRPLHRWLTSNPSSQSFHRDAAHLGSGGEDVALLQERLATAEADRMQAIESLHQQELTIDDLQAKYDALEARFKAAVTASIASRQSHSRALYVSRDVWFFFFPVTPPHSPNTRVDPNHHRRQVLVVVQAASSRRWRGR